MKQADENIGTILQATVPEIISSTSLTDDTSRATILIVEDNEDLRNYIRKNLADSYEIIETCKRKERPGKSHRHYTRPGDK